MFLNQVQPAQFWHQHTEWGASGDHTQCLCQKTQKGQHPPQHHMGDCEKSCTLQSHHQNLQALHLWETTYPLPPRGQHSKFKIRIFLQMLAQEQASLGKKLESFLKKLFLYFHFLQNLQDQTQNGYSSTNSFLCNMFHFCNLYVLIFMQLI